MVLRESGACSWMQTYHYIPLGLVSEWLDAARLLCRVQRHPFIIPRQGGWSDIHRGKLHPILYFVFNLLYMACFVVVPFVRSHQDCLKFSQADIDVTLALEQSQQINLRTKSMKSRSDRISWNPMFVSWTIAWTILMVLSTTVIIFRIVHRTPRVQMRLEIWPLVHHMSHHMQWQSTFSKPQHLNNEAWLGETHRN